jgi:hypothetical protein
VSSSKSSLLGLAFLLIFPVSSWAQMDPCNPQLPPINQRPRGRAAEADETRRDEMRRTQEKKANQERQSALKKDTDELFNLVTQLKESVDKTTEHTLSVDVIRKAQEIEKLAKSVREKMKGGLYCDLHAP